VVARLSNVLIVVIALITMANLGSIRPPGSSRPPGPPAAARATITLGRADGYHVVEIEPEGEGIDFGRAPERARGVRPLAYDVLEHVDERLWHVGGQLRVEPDRRRARRIVLATGIELAQAAE
jgi:hypothetical protein